MTGVTYWVWVEGKPGLPPHKLHAALLESHAIGASLGQSFGTWATALGYLRDLMKEGFICRVYEERG